MSIFRCTVYSQMEVTCAYRRHVTTQLNQCCLPGRAACWVIFYDRPTDRAARGYGTSGGRNKEGREGRCLGPRGRWRGTGTGDYVTCWTQVTLGCVLGIAEYRAATEPVACIGRRQADVGSHVGLQAAAAAAAADFYTFASRRLDSANNPYRSSWKLFGRGLRLPPPCPWRWMFVLIFNVRKYAKI